MHDNNCIQGSTAKLLKFCVREYFSPLPLLSRLELKKVLQKWLARLTSEKEETSLRTAPEKKKRDSLHCEKGPCRLHSTLSRALSTACSHGSERERERVTKSRHKKKATIPWQEWNPSSFPHWLKHYTKKRRNLFCKTYTQKNSLAARSHAWFVLSLFTVLYRDGWERKTLFSIFSDFQRSSVRGMGKTCKERKLCSFLIFQRHEAKEKEGLSRLFRAWKIPATICLYRVLLCC